MRITDNETARNWLDEMGINYSLDNNGEVIIERCCGRCGGTGYWSYGHWNKNGVCFSCDGSGGRTTVRMTVKEYAQKKKAEYARNEKAARIRREKVEAKEAALLEGQRRWCETNGYGRVTFAEREELKKQERAKGQEKQVYLGEVKERVEFEVTYETYFSFETHYGTTYIHKFVDDSGNVIIWKTSKGLYYGVEGYDDGFEKGFRCRIKGTVKEHQEYRGDKQTVLTRCKIVRA